MITNHQILAQLPTERQLEDLLAEDRNIIKGRLHGLLAEIAWLDEMDKEDERLLKNQIENGSLAQWFDAVKELRHEGIWGIKFHEPVTAYLEHSIVWNGTSVMNPNKYRIKDATHIGRLWNNENKVLIDWLNENGWEDFCMAMRQDKIKKLITQANDCPINSHRGIAARQYLKTHRVPHFHESTSCEEGMGRTPLLRAVQWVIYAGDYYHGMEFSKVSIAHQDALYNYRLWQEWGLI